MRATIGNADIYFSDEGEGIPVVFVHGLGGGQRIGLINAVIFSVTIASFALTSRVTARRRAMPSRFRASRVSSLPCWTNCSCPAILWLGSLPVLASLSPSLPHAQMR